MPPLLSGCQDAKGFKHLQDVFRQHAAPSAAVSAPSTTSPGVGQCTSHKGPHKETEDVCHSLS